MAEEAPGSAPASQPDGSGKRQSEDRAPTDDDSAPAADGTEPSAGGVYSSVPPPASEFDQAKRKAEELAAKFLNTGAKRSKFDEPPAAGGAAGAAQAAGGGRAFAGSSESVSIQIPNGRVGLIIGRGGETIKNLQNRSGARIQIQSDREVQPGSMERTVMLMGTKQQTDVAQELIREVLDESNRRGGPGFGGGFRQQQQWQGGGGGGGQQGWPQGGGYGGGGQTELGLEQGGYGGGYGLQGQGGYEGGGGYGQEGQEGGGGAGAGQG
ncbi:unnamed protein product [Closterium sp. NIES-53]